MTKKCAFCGKEFEASHKGCIYCSNSCKSKAKREKVRQWRERNLEYAREVGRKNSEAYRLAIHRVGNVNAPMEVCHSLSKILEAKTKPAWCSDVRWRIELRRRANVKMNGRYDELAAHATSGDLKGFSVYQTGGPRVWEGV